ncbi:alkylation response protein AidB-like acyl-CoA dehydrogenase [Microbacterium terrae]|uniref:3-methylmercaptopropionyl-CoA dehydrogenase n=1 Tax=Microbacterium terrae TaxID=69369 RepID=A0A0M2GVR8_9MICO|nr:acyl-CoA dehydrogenase [Microbacterium terrae]KJL37627.1 Acyl-CoA dehydrogenase, short-chain specific [Microbacterium terrae]MBP1076459.1 alkylation response protein AidB-like acyl-CoA dehydrogenase [Microbacterium terrae]GLJ97288.1 acyl-CoA dehydrogenase [Microbacterium terrae]
MVDASTYTAPVEDYAFLYREAFGADIVARATADAMTADDAIDVLTAAGEFAGEVLAPLDQVGDRVGATLVDGQARLPEGFAEAYAALVEGGWITAEAPESAGGDGLPTLVQNGLGEIWNASNMAFALCWMLTAGAIHALDAVASPEIRRIYLAPMVEGRWTGTMNLTEPQAGTDLGAIRTTATPNEDGTWSISGQKIFITWGDHDVAENIVHLVLARTPGAPDGAKGISLFVVPKFLVNPDGTPGERNGVQTVSLEHKIGIHGSPTAVLAYEGATGYLAGDLHGGLAGMFVMMNSARAGMGLQATGVSDRALQRAAAYAADRLQGPVLDRPAGAPIAEHPDVRRLLLSMSSEIFAMRAMGVRLGDLFDRAESDGTLAMAEFFVPIFKGWSTEEALRITSEGIQVHGGMGFIEETGIAQHYRDARIMPIYEGTTAIQSNDLVGRKVIRDGGATASALFDEITATVAALRAVDHAVATRTADRLERAVAAARRATDAVLGFASSPRDAYAVSVPYLMLLGFLVGGWMHALAVVAVAGHADAAPADARRLIEADFYGVHHLSRVASLAETVEAGEIA